VGLVRTNVSEESVSYIFWVERISKLGTLGVTSPLQFANLSNSLIPFTLRMEITSYSEISVLTRSIRCHIPEDGILKKYFRFINKF
jgi:hypothetical protein